VEEEYTVLAAQVVGAHGVGGNVRLRLIGQDPQGAARSLQSREQVRLLDDKSGDSVHLTLSSLRRQTDHKGAWIARFKEIKDRNAAEQLIGRNIYIPESGRAPLPEGEYYVDHLVGMDVITDTGRSLGRLADVIYSPANDVYETDTGVLIPAVSAFILSVDRDNGQILVRDVPGLTDDA
jgi:16S rRNA processing protein RimM